MDIEVLAMEEGAWLEPWVKDFLLLRNNGEDIFFIPCHFRFFFLGSVPNTRSASTDEARGSMSSLESAPLLKLAEEEGRPMSTDLGGAG